MSSKPRRNFLRELTDPVGARLDIVAVHGLNATDEEHHAYLAWTAFNGKMWLSDPEFLPKALPYARILLYGYNSNLAFEASTAGIHEHADNLLNHLKLKRKGSMQRPIIFICYSLGGIIVKKALIISKLDNTYASIHSSSYGIVFFGTPHRGGEFKNLGEIASSIAKASLQYPQNTLMESLKKDSLLADITAQYFRHQLEDYRVVTFFETRYFGESSQLIVDQRSATLGLPGPREKQIGLGADHVGLCKFPDRYGDDYEQVADNIVELAEQVLKDASECSKKASHWETKIFVLPDLLHPHFTGRLRELQELGLMLAKLPWDSCSKRVAIYGMPGVGKSQISFKFAYENQHRYSSIFYVQATDREKLLRDFMKIHGLLQLGGQSSSTQDQNLKIEVVKQWLVRNPDWLLVFDNVKHVSVVKEFLPAAGTGVIIFNTRSERIARHLGLAGKLELHCMDESDGVELILKISEFSAPTAEQKSLALRLHHELRGLPLALEQVVSSSHRRWLITEYFERLHTEKAKTLKHLAENTLENSSNCHFVFNLAVQDVTPTAVMLLKLITHFDHQNLPLRIFYDGQPALIRFLEIVEAPRCRDTVYLLQDLFGGFDGIEAAVSSLHSSALVRRDEAGVWMHDLFRGFGKELVLAPEGELLLTSAIVLVKSAFPHEIYDSGSSSISSISRSLAPHLVTSLEQAKEQALESKISHDAAGLLAKYFKYMGRYADALEWLFWVLAGQERFLGTKHTDTLGTVNNIAIVFEKQGKYEKALDWYYRALSGREDALGREHPSTLSTVNNIAIVFEKQGKYEKALDWYYRALSGREDALGKEHPSTLDTVNNIAIVFEKQGKYEKALDWYYRALSGTENALGKEHPSTLSTVNNIAITFKQQGMYSEAFDWFGRALLGREISLGKEHPDTLSTAHSIDALSKRGKGMKA